jgi:hypothetical protein
MASEILIKHDDGLIIQNNDKTGELLNVYYNSITKSLNLFEWKQGANFDLGHPVLNAIQKYKDHPSILKIRSMWGASTCFSFKRSPLKRFTI